ncbi:MAG TPA: carboxypeptidase-like regulatory domain-containing protein [Myxococcota bacterium]|jgi:hypothetical protein
MSISARLIQIALASSLVGCYSLGPIWAPRVEGRVVDARTGAPVAGAEVFATYGTRKWDSGPGNDWGITVATDSSWATTDRDGRFVLPAHWAIEPVPGGCATGKYPWLIAYHPDYGAMSWPNNVNYPEQNEQKERQFWDSVVIEIEPRKLKADATPLTVTGNVLESCRWGKLTRAACERLCDVSVGPAACERYDVEAAAYRREKLAERASAPPPAIVTSGSPALHRPRIVPSR